MITFLCSDINAHGGAQNCEYLSITVSEVSILTDTSLYRYFPSLVSSPAMFSINSNSSSNLSRKSEQICLQMSFWSGVKFFGTNFAQFFKNSRFDFQILVLHAPWVNEYKKHPSHHFRVTSTPIYELNKVRDYIKSPCIFIRTWSVSNFSVTYLDGADYRTNFLSIHKSCTYYSSLIYSLIHWWMYVPTLE